jgi:DNA-binding SARP family transcriptional activator
MSLTADAEALGCPAVELRLLGGFELSVGGTTLELSAMSQRLVALVALHGKPMPRMLAAATLWPEKTETRAYANLRSCLWRHKEPEPHPILVGAGSSLALGPDVALDVRRLERLGWAMIDGDGPPPPAEHCDLFTLPLLPGWYDDWVVMERERLALLQARFVEALVGALVASGQLTRAVNHAIRLVGADPLRERSQLCLLEVFAAEGSWGQIYEQLRSYEALLQTTFGCGVTGRFRAAVAELVPEALTSTRGRT